VKTLSLQNILDALINVKKTPHGSSAKRYTIYDMGILGGMKRSILMVILFSLPFIEFAIIFNPVSFEFLGIAQAIIFFIIFMSIIMIIVFALIWKNNKKVFTALLEPWNNLFPDVDLKMLLSLGITPYSGFYAKYAPISEKNLDEESLKKALRDLFDQIQEENKDLLEMMEKTANS
jgi:hypothetical protein